MKVIFKYNRKKDIWCLLNKGKSSNNSSNPTKVYRLLMTSCGENPTEEETSNFIDKYFSNNKIDVHNYIKQYQTDWNSIKNEYHKIAESIFDTHLPNNITAYLTVNNRNPYSIENNQFYVTVPSKTMQKTIMHELWHFYTWYGLGADQEKMLGKQKYNDVKEALTVLLNEECSHLMAEEVYDVGYPQHQELREEIKQLWKKRKDIHWLWKELANKKYC